MIEKKMSKPDPVLSLKKDINLRSIPEDHRMLYRTCLQVYSGESAAILFSRESEKHALIRLLTFKDEQKARDKLLDGPIKGFYVVKKDPLLFPNMTAQENILIGLKEPFDKLYQRLAGWMADLSITLFLSQKARSMTLAQQQMMDILRSLMRQPNLLIMDEPTLYLTKEETDRLYGVFQKLKGKGVGILFFSHRLANVMRFGDRALVMREGELSFDGALSGIRPEKLLHYVTAQETPAQKNFPQPSAPSAADPAPSPQLQIEALSGTGFHQISLQVFSGEIVGLCGLAGSGRRELALTLFGQEKSKSGKITLDGRDITGLDTRHTIDQGLYYLPPNTEVPAMYEQGTVKANINASCLAGPFGFFETPPKRDDIRENLAGPFHLDSPGPDQQLDTLSAIDQKRVMMMRALATGPKLLVLGDPLQGIPRADRESLYAMIRDIKHQGIGILLLSSEFEDILALADRALCMYRGRVSASFSAGEITPNGLYSAAFGLEKRGEEDA